MHVVQVLVSLNLGGSELVAVELTEHLAAAGHRVTVIAADGPLGERAVIAHLDDAERALRGEVGTQIHSG